MLVGEVSYLPVEVGTFVKTYTLPWQYLKGVQFEWA